MKHFLFLTQRFLLALSVCILFIACNKDDKVFDSCCDNPALEATVGNGRIYIPNIFTPDGDDLNDYFLVFGDSIREISSVTLSNEDGSSVFESGLFEVNNPIRGWDGRIGGKVKEGIFDYSIIVVAENGVISVLEGKVCSHPCDEDSKGPRVSGVENCQFPTQVIDGRFDATISSLEADGCFE